MSKNAATENQLGALHSTLARVFTKVLEKYERQMEALDSIAQDKIEQEMVDELFNVSEPSPAMLSAISKFLKDNDIGMDSGEIEQLNATERRLKDRRAARASAGLNLTLVPHVGEA